MRLRQLHRQSSYPCSINFSNPLSKGIVSAITPATGLRDLAKPSRVLTYGSGISNITSSDGPTWSNSNQTTSGIFFASGGWGTVIPTTVTNTFFVRAYIPDTNVRRVLLGDWSSAGDSNSTVLESGGAGTWDVYSGSNLVGSGGTVTVGWHNFVLSIPPDVSTFYLWIDGIFIMSGSMLDRANGVHAAFMEAGDYEGGIGWGDKGSLLVISTQIANSAIARSFHNNPWQFFTPLKRTIWTDTIAAAATTYRPTRALTGVGY